MFKKLLFTILATFTSSIFALSLTDAEDAIREGAPLSAFAQFKGHPLYPYLEYRAYREHLATTNPSEIVLLLNQYPNAPFSGWLAEHAFPMWLLNGNSAAIVAAYHDDLADDSIECEYRMALLNVGEIAKARADIADLWLSENTIESACDPLFQRFIAEGVIDQSLIRERFTLAMNANESAVARHVSRFLAGSSAADANKWLDIDQGALPLISALTISHPALRSAALGAELRDKASKQTDAVLLTAQQALAQGAFVTDSDQGQAFNRLTRVLADGDDARALQTWQAIPKGQHDRNTIYDVIAYLLRQQQWAQVPDTLTRALSSDDLERAEVQYWIAKAYEKTNQDAKATAHYRLAASKRDFFGFLAADKLNQSYQMNDQSIVRHPQTYLAVISRPEAYRMQTWLRLGKTSRAGQEYNALIRGLSEEELKQAALFAHEQNWPIQGIVTLTKIKFWDALNVRFPTLYQAKVTQLARKHQLSPATIYAIIRKESIFQPDIKSPAGALGLMQVMPATAADTARKYNIPYSGQSQLTDIDTNLRIGSQYLHDRLQEFGHLAYAAAAYNAGPHRVNRWLAANPNLPLDEWIAQIPFNETRDYVKRVLEYEKIYEYRLGLPVQRFSAQNIRPY